MRLLSLEAENFRNITRACFEPDAELTVIAGDNGQGKTNLMEAVWMLTGSKSFRGAKDMELVKLSESVAKIEGKTQDNSKENLIALRVMGEGETRRGRYASVNGVDYGRAGEIAGIFTAVVFAPDHLHLVKGSPEGRRRFLDAALCQLYPGYVGVLRRFSRALSQKNALLKNYYKTVDADGLLDVFNKELAGSGADISKRRREYVEKLGPAAQDFYASLSQNAEALRVSFMPCCTEESLYELLCGTRQADIRAGFSTAGPQREDLEMSIDNNLARNFASQGQQRSAVLSLKLAEAAVAKVITGSHPVLLLDDVLSELDDTRQSFLLSRTSEQQSFVTTCDATAFSRTRGKVLRMENGRIME